MVYLVYFLQFWRLKEKKIISKYLDSLHEWLSTNKLLLNIGKTN